MRIKAEIWAKAYIRRCYANDAPAAVVRRGQNDGGAIYIKISTLDGNAAVYGPAPAGLDASGRDRLFALCAGRETMKEDEANIYLRRQSDFDPDIWIIEVEDREGRHFLGDSLSQDMS